MTKEQLIHRLGEIDDAIERLETDKKKTLKQLIDEHCPYKLGQKAKYVRVQTKRTGNVFAGDFKVEKIGEREEILVCVSIKVCDWSYNEYRYEFRRLKADGALTQNLVHASRKDIEWLDEYYEPKK